MFRRIVVVFREFLRGFELTAPHVAVLTTTPDSKSGSLATSGKLKARGKRKKGAQAILSAADLEEGNAKLGKCSHRSHRAGYNYIKALAVGILLGYGR